MGLADKAKTLIRLTREKRVLPIPEPINVQKTLAGKVALVTGGDGGIGFAIAEAFVAAGAHVVIAGRNETRLESCCEKIGGGCSPLCIDVTDIASLPEKVREASLLGGKDRIDILVNSAGVIPHLGFEDMTEAEYDRVMDINAKGTFFMCQVVGKYMVERGVHGHILNVTSSSALRPAWGPYQMSKWAVRGFTLGLADLMLSKGIVVNAIAPGPTATPMLGKDGHKDESIYLEDTPSKRFTMPSEIAQLAVFMVGPMGDQIVGDTFYMTGGSGTISLHH